MNKELILELADRIEESETYDQSDYYTWCRAPACIAGHCVAMHPEFVEFVEESHCICEGSYQHISDLAEEMLELEKDQAAMLFLAIPPGHTQYGQLGAYATVTNATAARVLRHLAKTGQVEWEEEDK